MVEEQKATCSVCKKKVNTYLFRGELMIANHNFPDTELQCHGSCEPA